jgi:hypothetical protein
MHLLIDGIDFAAQVLQGWRLLGHRFNLGSNAACGARPLEFIEIGV